jgi:hypothetical protein
MVMKNLYLIPTEKPSRLFYYNNHLGLARNFVKKNDGVNPQHIYITNDDEIKDGDDKYGERFKDGEYILYNSIDGISIFKKTKYNICSGNFKFHLCKKIILTTDQELIADGVQAIDDIFLEWFVKNPSCEEVKVINNETGNYREFDSTPNLLYKIIIPKEELKNPTTLVVQEAMKIVSKDVRKPKCVRDGIIKEEPKSHSFCETPEEKCTMNYCDENGCQNRKRILVKPKEEPNFYEKLVEYFKNTPREKVLEDWNKTAEFDNIGLTMEEFLDNTEETLEEAMDKNGYHDEVNDTMWRKGVKFGAKWQQERMYIESDKIMKFLDTEVELKLSDAKTIERIKWYFETYFEQFKKK